MRVFLLLSYDFSTGFRSPGSGIETFTFSQWANTLTRLTKGFWPDTIQKLTSGLWSSNMCKREMLAFTNAKFLPGYPDPTQSTSILLVRYTSQDWQDFFCTVMFLTSFRLTWSDTFITLWLPAAWLLCLLPAHWKIGNLVIEIVLRFGWKMSLFLLISPPVWLPECSIECKKWGLNFWVPFGYAHVHFLWLLFNQLREWSLKEMWVVNNLGKPPMSTCLSHFNHHGNKNEFILETLNKPWFFNKK